MFEAIKRLIIRAESEAERLEYRETISIAVAHGLITEEERRQLADFWEKSMKSGHTWV